MKNIYLIFLLFIILTGCKKDTPPKGILDEDKMVSVLIDIHLAEGLVGSFPIHYDSSRSLYPILEKRVFEKHQVADTVFINSLRYYLKDLKKMDKIYARTIDSLNMYEKVGEQ